MDFINSSKETLSQNFPLFLTYVIASGLIAFIVIKLLVRIICKPEISYHSGMPRYKMVKKYGMPEYLKFIKLAVKGDYGNYKQSAEGNFEFNEASYIASTLGDWGIIQALPYLKKLVKRKGSMIVRQYEAYFSKQNNTVVREYDNGDNIRNSAKHAIKAILKKHSYPTLYFFKLRVIFYLLFWFFAFYILTIQ